MKKNYLFLLLLFPSFIWSQGITVSTDAFTPTQLITDVFLGSNCVDVSNVTASSACGVGYFNANGGTFPFTDGIIIRSGQAANTAGTYTGVGTSSVCSSQTDVDLQQIFNANGFTGTIQDASFIKFHFVTETESISFDYIFASQDYGQYQCSPFGDAVAFILTNLTTGQTINMAVVPNTNLPVSINTIRDNTFNANCPSANPEYFDNYNLINPAASSINLIGNTVPMTATAFVVPGAPYSLKIVVGDNSDMAQDSAIFIKGGSAFQYLCDETIKMVAFLDTNNNGIKDDEEINFNHGTFRHKINNAGDFIYNYSPTGNVFIEGNPTNIYDLNYIIDTEFLPYFNTTTSYNDITIIEGDGLSTYYFPINNIQPYNDVEVRLVSINQPRPGFLYYQNVIISNNGTTPSNGTLAFNKDPLLSAVNVNPDSGIVITPTGFTYDYTDLLPNQELSFPLTSLIPTIPTVALGDYIVSTGTVTTTNTDINLENNINEVSEIIVGAYDPNDKMESHGAKIPFESFDSNDYLEYTIRFQNTGTFYATRVRIEDELEAQLDLSSLQMIGASHPYTLNRINNKLLWTFEDILLPGIAEGDDVSQGYVRFKIKPNAGFAIGDIITNEASIIFDFNPPIVTNLFATEFTTTLSTPDFNDNSLVVYPNPTHTTATISSKNDSIESLKITDVAGKVIKTITVNSTSYTINVSDLSTGIYLLELKNSKQERIVKKLIIN